LYATPPAEPDDSLSAAGFPRRGLCLEYLTCDSRMTSDNISYPVVTEDRRLAGWVSLIIPCYNGESFVREAIECALGQSWPNVEVVVVDDGSTDRTAEILREYGDKIGVVSQANCGLPGARNSGIRSSRGEFLCFLDVDDYLSPQFTQVMAEALMRSGAAVAYCGWQNIGAQGRSNEPHVPPDYEASNKLESFLRSASPWPVHAAMVRADVLRETGGFNESLPTCEDYEFWLRVALTRPIVRVPQVMAFYRHHGQAQMSSNRWRQARYTWLIKRDFIKRSPQLVAGTPSQRLREWVDGALYERGFDAYWRRDLVSAHRIFRMLLRAGYWTPKDLKYLLPAVLPEGTFKRIVRFLERGRR